MPNEFVATPINNDKTTTSKPKRPIQKRTVIKKSTNGQEIHRAISVIYQDDNGQMPNMKKIDMKTQHPFMRFFVTLLILGGLLCAIAWVGFFIIPNNKTDSDQVVLTIDGPTNSIFGATTTYTISYENNQNIKLNEAVLTVNYPAGFEFITSSKLASNAGNTEWNLGNITNQTKETLTITGRLYNTPNQEQSWRIFFNYQPENFNSQMQKTATLNIKTDSSPLALKITGPDKATIGSEVEYSFKIEKQNENYPLIFYVMPVLPNNFHLTTSSPILIKNRWPIDLTKSTSTEPLASLQFTLRGTYTDGDSSSTPIKAQILVPGKLLVSDIVITENSLPIELTKNVSNFNIAINGNLQGFSIQPGDSLAFTVNVKNAGQVDMNKAIIKLDIDAPSFNKQSLLNWKAINDPADGNIQGIQLSDTIRRGEIIWNNTKISALKKIKPNDEVSIDFTIPLKDANSITLSDFAEYKIVVASELSYTDANNNAKILPGAPITITINSDFKLENRYTKTSSADGKENYDIKWVLTNNFHPLKNIKLSANLYGDFTFTPPQTAPAGAVVYDNQEKKITWTIPEMPDSVDVLALPLNITLNKKNPTQNMLVGKIHVTADDTVTGQSIDFMGNEIAL